MKKILIVVGCICTTTIGIAQTAVTETAQQIIQLNLDNTIEIAFSSNNTSTGSLVTLPFNTVNDFSNGVESTQQELHISSNKHFSVTVNTLSSFFNVTNNGITTPSNMPSSVLSLQLISNNTGGTVGQHFTASNYYNLSSSAVSLIANANNGYIETFAIKYKAMPGFVYPSGVYANDVVYTATQQ